ncbi:MAG TPA: ABC transporter permease, partial [Gemmatimonadaceae bacterium]|nr:ABC transporter permease [Gemmatimonadaceae bacterium]
MAWLPRGVRRAFRLERRTAADHAAAVDAELAFHLEMRAAEYEAAGMSPDEARAAARRKFGDLDDARRYCRGLDQAETRTRRRRDWAAGWRHDLRSSVRQLRAAPAVTVAAILTLALGIGATTALYSVVHKLLVAPLAYPHGDRLVWLTSTAAKGDVLFTPSPALVDAWRSARALDRVERYQTQELARTDGAEPELLQGAAISPGLPALLGVRPQLGRLFRPDEATAGAAPVVLLGYGYWQRVFGGAEDVVGRTVTLDGQVRTIVGVLPRDFRLPFDDEAARAAVVPLVPDPEAQGAGTAIGRLRAGVSAATASAELTSIARRVDGRDDEMGAKAVRPQDLLGHSTQRMLLVLLAATLLVLLIGCANVAGLLLARATARQRELAVRAALGAGRGRIVRQLLTESALLGLSGGAAGLLVAWGALRLVVALRPPSLDELAGLQPQPAVLGLALALATLTGLVFGLAPALFAAERGAAASLTGASRTSTGHRRSQRLRGALVALEVALSAVLLVGAGLLLRSVGAMQATDVGFDTHGITAMSLRLPEKRYESEAARAALYGRVLDAVRRVPGVTQAEVGSGPPPRGGLRFGNLEVEGRTLAADEQVSIVGFSLVGPGHFRFLGLPLLDGRIPTDTVGSPLVVNETFARRYWPGGRAVGQRLRFDEDSPWQTVAAVVGDVRLPGGSVAHELQIYELSLAGMPWQTTLSLRVADGAENVIGGVTRAVLAVDPALKLRDVWTVEAAIDERLAGP